MTVEMMTAWVQFAAEIMIFFGVAYNTIQSCLTNRKLKKVHTKVTAVEGITTDTNKRVEAVEISSNGMRAELVALTEKEAFARGSASGAATVAAAAAAAVSDKDKIQQLDKKP